MLLLFVLFDLCFDSDVFDFWNRNYDFLSGKKLNIYRFDFLKAQLNSCGNF